MEELPSPEDPSFSYLLGRLALIEERVRQAVTVTNEDAAPSLADSLLGIHMSPEHIMKLFDQPRAHLLDESHNQELRAELEAWADHLEHTGVRLRLRELIRAFSLSSLDIEVLLIALAPEVDARFGQFYAYLNSDITCRRATIQLALLLCSASTASAADRARFTLHAPLVGGGLLTLQESEGPWPSQTLRVANRVVAHLLGDDSLDEGLIDTAYLACPQLLPMAVAHCQATQRLAAAVVRGEPLAYIQQDDPHTATALAVDAVTAAEESALVLHLGKDTSTEQVALLVSTALREARLRNCALIIGPADRTIPHLPSHALVPSWQDQPLPMIVTGACSWDPAWSQRLPLRITASPPTPAERTAQWQAALGELASQLPSAAAEMAASYRLSAKHIHQTVDAARRHAELEGTAVNLSHLRTSARVHNAAGLERLARRISPTARWEELILPLLPRSQLRELPLRARHRDLVIGTWRMRPANSRGLGVTALFSGESGTGKTLAAEVVAADLGLDLYVVDLASVVDKYIGETEKNLDRIFTEATNVNAVLLFDEADALFAKRTQVQDAHDRYANLETAYLLQRLESFDGLAMMTTNLHANLDPAFTRRLDMIIHFPLPDAHHRRLLWDQCLGTSVPRDDDLDLTRLANTFDLVGGSIRSCALTAAYQAAVSHRPISTASLLNAVRTEYRKLRRLINEEEFTVS
ncbi:ATP-binding protein [Streptomyces sp. WZ-12]|uniref:ATP-binding protein n=1 Tax=Streptomyces sp. WZ-12 TaxID=3030210 RepID=UPI002381050A|nr:ATP-binding protein [Streptomyces sp. WZ-12]